MKKLVSLILALVMMLSLFVVSVNAKAAYEINITDVNGSQSGDFWNYEKGTLTLSDYEGGAIFIADSAKDISIVVLGDNIIDAGTLNGIYSESNITFSGDGSLSIVSEAAAIRTVSNVTMSGTGLYKLNGTNSAIIIESPFADGKTETKALTINSGIINCVSSLAESIKVIGQVDFVGGYIHAKTDADMPAIVSCSQAFECGNDDSQSYAAGEYGINIAKSAVYTDGLLIANVDKTDDSDDYYYYSDTYHYDDYYYDDASGKFVSKWHNTYKYALDITAFADDITFDANEASWEYDGSVANDIYISTYAGWQKLGGSWYFFDKATGEMHYGWLNTDGKWYYLDPDTGKMHYDWNKIDGYWWYMFGPDEGHMATGWEKISGKWYYFKPGDSGRMLTGWQKIGGYWYYLNLGDDGSAATGWKQIDGKWYYFKPGDSCRMLTGWQKINGYWYYLNLGNDGSMASGWKKINGYWYYLDPSNDSRMATGWKQINGKWYYFNPSNDSRMTEGWLQIGGKWYYFKPTDGYMVTGTQSINGKTYRFNSNGAWLG